jgi:ribosomal protein S18 acetylase RimI-like enzyme
LSDRVSPDLTIRRLKPADIAGCEAVLRSIPEWFGIEDANTAYIRDLETLPSYVATEGRLVVGFLAARQHFPEAGEIHIIAVERSRHGRGIGRALLEAAEADLRANGCRLLQVKTLGPSDDDEGYRRTREFYFARGFMPLEETDAFWGSENPALVMVKVLDDRVSNQT